jgi:reductive dehalogenase
MKANQREPTYKQFITGPIKRFDERQTGFSRADRGEIKRPSEALHHGLKTKAAKDELGHTREDYALNLAARTIDTMIRKMAYSREDLSRRWSMEGDPTPVTDATEISGKVKRVARWFGASLVGICEVNALWIYSHWGEHYSKPIPEVSPGDPIELPEEFRYAVVIAVEMEYEDVKRSPAVCPSIDLGYSKMAFVATSVAEYIRLLGYNAIPSGNDMALNIPLAIDAGLGEMGRNGILITEKYGPRVRLCKVFTDLPLVPDEPVDLGVQHFCKNCKLCAKHCPGQALMKEERSDRPIDISNNSGVLKWQVNADRCLSWWYRSGTTGCAVCIRTCPWNKPQGMIHNFVRAVNKRTSLFDWLFVRGDEWMGYGKQVIYETPNEKRWGQS